MRGAGLRCRGLLRQPVRGFSTDGGNNFQDMSPQDFMKLEGETFCCDQRVEFVPNLGAFVWVMLSLDGPLILAVASPDDIRDSNGKSWTYYHLTPAMLGYERSSTFDYPRDLLRRRISLFDGRRQRCGDNQMAARSARRTRHRRGSIRQGERIIRVPGPSDPRCRLVRDTQQGQSDQGLLVEGTRRAIP